MNREILFKAKRTDNGEWVEGALFYGKDHCIIGQKIKFSPYVTMECKIVGYEVDPETICQYTGLTDKNGNNIWENDIIFDDKVYSLVRWDNETVRFVIDDYGTNGLLMEYGYDEDAGEYDVVDTNGFDDFCDDPHMMFEVVGNIFDNPELLNQ